jgi:hypothetical protein
LLGDAEPSAVTRVAEISSKTIPNVRMPHKTQNRCAELSRLAITILLEYEKKRLTTAKKPHFEPMRLNLFYEDTRSAQGQRCIRASAAFSGLGN